MDFSIVYATTRDLYFKIGMSELERTLKTQGHRGFCSLHNSASVEGYTEQVLQTLDKGSCMSVWFVYLHYFYFQDMDPTRSKKDMGL